MSTAIKHFPNFFNEFHLGGGGVGLAALQTEILAIRRAGQDTGQLPLTCGLQRKHSGAMEHLFDPWLLHRDGQISTNCGRAQREVLWCDISPWKPA